MVHVKGKPDQNGAYRRAVCLKLEGIAVAADAKIAPAMMRLLMDFSGWFSGLDSRPECLVSSAVPKDAEADKHASGRRYP
jgi:hypothetical protein